MSLTGLLSIAIKRIISQGGCFCLTFKQSQREYSQWKRVVTTATITAFNGLGGVAGSFLFRQHEAPRYLTAIWVSIG
jgi:hypothetical protein